jgi:hypothetical protein
VLVKNADKDAEIGKDHQDVFGHVQRPIVGVYVVQDNVRQCTFLPVRHPVMHDRQGDHICQSAEHEEQSSCEKHEKKKKNIKRSFSSLSRNFLENKSIS